MRLKLGVFLLKGRSFVLSRVSGGHVICGTILPSGDTDTGVALLNSAWAHGHIYLRQSANEASGHTSVYVDLSVRDEIISGEEAVFTIQEDVTVSLPCQGWLWLACLPLML